MLKLKDYLAGKIKSQFSGQYGLTGNIRDIPIIAIQIQDEKSSQAICRRVNKFKFRNDVKKFKARVKNKNSIKLDVLEINGTINHTSTLKHQDWCIFFPKTNNDFTVHPNSWIQRDFNKGIIT